MGTLVTNDAKLIMGGYDVSGYANQAVMELNPEMLDQTRFGSQVKDWKPGLAQFKLTGKGFTDYTPVGGNPSFDDMIYGKLALVNEVFTVAPVGNADGDIAYTTRGVSGSYDAVNVKIGELAPFSLDVFSRGQKPVRGSVQGVGAKTVNGTSTGVQLGAVAAAPHKLYGALHVTAITGTTPTLAVIVESDDNSGFTSPTTRLTFAGFTTSVGASWQFLAGPLTDTYYRLKWTIGGTTPSYRIFGVIGIL